MINLLVETALRTGIHEAQLFKDAYDFNEIRQNTDEMMLDFEEIYVKNKLPEFVVDYLLTFWSNGLATNGQK